MLYFKLASVAFMVTFSLAMFDWLMSRLRSDVTRRLSGEDFPVNPADIEAQLPPEILAAMRGEAPQAAREPELVGASQPSSPEIEAPADPRAGKPLRQTPDVDPNNPESWGKVGRNDACPCGSGKKFKHCHGRN